MVLVWVGNSTLVVVRVGNSTLVVAGNSKLELTGNMMDVARSNNWLVHNIYHLQV